MADLDDFFKKKDGKKSKGKKYAVSDPLSAHVLENGNNGKIKREKTTKLVSKPLFTQENDVFSTQDDAEWIEIKEEKKDYSGLRLQNLTLAEETKVDTKTDDDDEFEVDEKGDTIKKKTAGPWKPIADMDAPYPHPEEKPKKIVEVVKPEPEPASYSSISSLDRPAAKNAYVPPQRRRPGFDRAAPTTNGTATNKKANHVEREMFPMLGATHAGSGKK